MRRGQIVSSLKVSYEPYVVALHPGQTELAVGSKNVSLVCKTKINPCIARPYIYTVHFQATFNNPCTAELLVFFMHLRMKLRTFEDEIANTIFSFK